MKEITYHREGDYFIPDLYLDFFLTHTNNCFKIYTKFTEIGSDIYEERTHKNTNESKR